MGQQDGSTFNSKLLRRFINLMGVFPAGTIVRLESDEIAVVTREHPGGPFRPQVTVMMDGKGERIEEPVLVNTWEREAHDVVAHAVAEAVDPAQVGAPLAFTDGTDSADTA